MAIAEYSPSEVAGMLGRGEAVLIDVREKDEHACERIAGSVLMPLSSFNPAQLPEYQGKTAVFQCVSGMRSARAASMCAAGGMSNVANLAGGILAWKRAGLPTERGV